MIEPMYEPVKSNNSEKMTQCLNKIVQYEKYKYNLRKAKQYCEEVISGINILENSQYEKVKSNCIDAIGEQSTLLEALKIKNTNMSLVANSMLEEIEYGIKKINDEIDQLNSLKKTIID